MALKWPPLLLALLVFTVANARSLWIEDCITKCPEHEHVAICGKYCEGRCKDGVPQPGSCPPGCESKGCTCDDGYFRDETYTCVPCGITKPTTNGTTETTGEPVTGTTTEGPTETPVTGTTGEPVTGTTTEGPTNIPVTGTTGEPVTGTTTEGPTEIPVTGTTGEQVTNSEEPTTEFTSTTAEPLCPGSNEILHPCGSTCQIMCSEDRCNPKSECVDLLFCNMSAPACVCKRNYCFDGTKCILNTKCGCGENEVIHMCGRKCEENCNADCHPPPECQKLTCAKDPACICKPGYVRDDARRACVKAGQCTQKRPGKGSLDINVNAKDVNLDIYTKKGGRCKNCKKRALMFMKDRIH